VCWGCGQLQVIVRLICYCAVAGEHCLPYVEALTAEVLRPLAWCPFLRAVAVSRESSCEQGGRHWASLGVLASKDCEAMHGWCVLHRRSGWRLCSATVREWHSHPNACMGLSSFQLQR
jgi:hypothetical protein